MNTLVSFYQSSIGKKVVMSLTGLFLCLFLIEHLVGNLLLFVNDGGRLYEAYMEILVSNPVIRAIEILLFASLFGHAISGVVLWIKNRRSRPQKYEVYRLDQNAEFASRITMLSGSVIFLFLVVHLNTFFVPLRLGETHPSAFNLIRESFSRGWYSAFYIFSLVILAYHLRHGFQSAFQTLGWKGKRYSVLLEVLAFLFWFVIPLGFASLPIYFYFFQRATASAVVIGAQ